MQISSLVIVFDFIIERIMLVDIFLLVLYALVC